MTKEEEGSGKRWQMTMIRQGVEVEKALATLEDTPTMAKSNHSPTSKIALYGKDMLYKNDFHCNFARS